MGNKFREKVKEISRNHSIIFSIIAVGSTLIADPVTEKIVNVFINDTYIPKIISEMLCGIIMLVLGRIIFSGKENMGFRRKGFFYGIMLSWLFILFGVNNFDFNYLNSNGIHIPALGIIAGYVVYNMAIGFYEEVMMRGLVLNNFINLYGESKKGIIYSVCISSLIFGVAHLCNLVESPQLINATLSQVLYASFIGIFFASVYLRCGNIWAVIVLHGFIDFAADFKRVFSTYTEIQAAWDITLQEAVMNVIYFLPLALVGLFLLRKVQPKLLDQNNNVI